jgi:hypothetical protein
VDEDPLIRLGCGHAFMLSSLDGATELAVFYDRSREQDRWTGLKCVPAGDTKCPACPDCRYDLYDRVHEVWLLEVQHWCRQWEFCNLTTCHAY